MTVWKRTFECREDEIGLKILITPTSLTPDRPSAALDLLRARGCELVFNDLGRPLQPQEIIARLDGVDGYLAGLDYITAEVIEAAPPSLKVISRYGAGYDRVDLEAANKKGIAVTNTPGANAQAVAELAFGLMLAVARKIPALDRAVRDGKWIRSNGVELYGKTLGIVGFGAIGKLVARQAKGFSMHVLVYDPYVDDQVLAEYGLRRAAWEELLAQSDFISLHLPLNEQTKHLINADAISRMKTTAILINTSRGGLIDEQAAYEALAAGRLGGLGLDAFEAEPPGDSPLFKLDQVVVTPHTGAHTEEAIANTAMMAVRNLLDVLEGRPCSYRVA